MKNKWLWSQVFLFSTLLGGMTIVGCEGKRGPVGPSGSADCILCHSDDTTIPRIVAEWKNSVHASGEHIKYGDLTNKSFCGSFCHTSEGFVALVETGVKIDVERPSAIGCFTCHAPHTKRNFDLRTDIVYTLMNGAVFDYGKGNLCANCHHSRENVNTYVSTPTTFGDSHWGPHVSVQSDMLAGENGYEYSWYTPGYGDSYHTNAVRTLDGCVRCHMDHGEGYTLGGHSWNMEWDKKLNLVTCNTDGCHGADPLETFDYKDRHSIIEAYLDTLGEALIAAKLLDSTFLPIDTATTSADSAGAVWNFLLVEDDQSYGVHNFEYAKALLESAIMFLRGEL
jgi:hypothetical protein